MSGVNNFKRDTPRTFAKHQETVKCSGEVHGHYGWKFAGQLERELAEAKVEREEFRSMLNELAERNHTYMGVDADTGNERGLYFLVRKARKLLKEKP